MQIYYDRDFINAYEVVIKRITTKKEEHL